MIVNGYYKDKNGNYFIDELFDLAKKEYNCTIGKSTQVFHYTSPQGLENILKTSSLRFSDSECLNDKTEGRYFSDLFYSFLDDLFVNEADFPKFKAQILEYVHLNENKYFCAKSIGHEYSITSPKCKYFICSFSLQRDSLSMWNYYTKNNNKSGYNLCFTKAKLKKSIIDSMQQKTFDSAGFDIYKVLYDAKKQKHFLKSIILFTYEKWKETKLYGEYIIGNLATLLFKFKYIFKHPDFMAEKEVRIVIELPEDEFKKQISNGTVKVRCSDYGFIPYMDLSFNKTDLKSITASPLTPNYSSVNNLLKFYNYKNVLVDKSNIPLRY